MIRRTLRVTLLLAVVVAFPHVCPAPLIYKPGEGWSYEPYGGDSSWKKTRAKDQLEVAEKAFEKKDYDLSLKAARLTVNKWPLSDYAPKAQFLVGRSLEELKKDEEAFKAYQTLLEKYPKAENYQDVLKRQFEIANRYLGGQWFKLWGVIPFFPSMEKTSKMYEKVIKNGPYSDVAPLAQMSIGTANEKRGEFTDAVKAYEKAADKYHDQKNLAADALFKAGQTHLKQAKTAEYDQGVAAKAIATFTDFISLYPDDKRVPEARKNIDSLRAEQARGAMKVAQFYEKKKQWSGALVYYNEVLIKDPDSTFAAEAKHRIEFLKTLPGVAAGPAATTGTNAPPAPAPKP
ncbi:MAG: outer membrane protein assembly factor BamD [Proteobacteria bacterium]|nr:outer membrane protein assembly factor BamD [Verrucomicrobiota bacterium]NBU07576.1 outer membrane protein assembly factor BamD [Pseudomonadota bacterium]